MEERLGCSQLQHSRHWEFHAVVELLFLTLSLCTEVKEPPASLKL